MIDEVLLSKELGEIKFVSWLGVALALIAVIGLIFLVRLLDRLNHMGQEIKATLATISGKVKANGEKNDSLLKNQEIFLNDFETADDKLDKILNATLELVSYIKMYEERNKAREFEKARKNGFKQNYQPANNININSDTQPRQDELENKLKELLKLLHKKE